MRSISKSFITRDLKVPSEESSTTIPRISDVQGKRLFGCLWILLFSLLTPCLLHCQQENGSVTGTVKDISGAIVTKAAVTAINTQTQQGFKTNTNEAGQYSILLMPIGTYDLNVTSSGFQTEIQHFELHGNDHLQIDLTLHVGNTSDTVTIRSEVPLLESQTGDSGMTLSAEQVQNLPLLGRNPFMLGTMTPGVNLAPGQQANVSQRPFDVQGFDWILVNGGRGYTTEVTMDGLSDVGSEEGSASEPANTTMSLHPT